ncbi:helix-turn-helix transcriptional regulator [Natronomonas sp. F2-12]|jgi:DNA-binding HxlR family transcriptional regulator|uniref:Helix-turn-helix transcriptional regulator n=1 Tax=Natronomonas aquatica TaxID=2841590 RepID=A0A9R1CUU1_9EURY|nr:helix-turn-helix domain-containing protein [Natronomonas aquatica]MCQ4334167.1 helix-turn-helix transcriptional regulator [Natronomonas aquatica]
MSTEGIDPARMDSTYTDTQAVLIDVSALVSHKWHPIVVHQLLTEGSLGFSGLKSRIDGISSKMLSESLTALEEWGVVERSIVEEKPVRVRYSLTDGGRALEPVLGSMVEWGRVNLERSPDAPDRSHPVVASCRRSGAPTSEGGR